MLDFTHTPNLGEPLRDAVARFKRNTALIEVNREREQGRWTYGEFGKSAEGVAGGLQSAGFAPGHRCAILMSNQAKWLISATGAIWAGAVLVPLDYKLTPKEQLALLLHSEASFLITEWPIWSRLVQEKDPRLGTMKVWVTDAPSGAALGSAKRWETQLSCTHVVVQRKRNDVACIVYSSGTGGSPKGCMLTHGNYLSQGETLGNMYPIRERDRYFSFLPTNHAIDFMCGFFLPLLFGGAIVHQRTLRPEFLSFTMKQYRITHMALVPMLLKALEKKVRDGIEILPPWKRHLCSALITINAQLTKTVRIPALSRFLLKPIHDSFGGKLELIIAGGAFVDPSTVDFFYRCGLPVVIGYGLTEAGVSLTLNDLRPFRSDTVGKPIPGIEFQLCDRNAQGVGEVCVKGPMVMKGYWKNEELTQATIENGWLRTGDLGTQEPSGHVRLVGRTKNMIVTPGGKNIYPEDIEASFEGLEEAQEQCVFSSNYVWPTQPLGAEKLMLVVRPRSELSRERLKKIIQERNQKLAEHKRVSGFYVWEQDFPRTATMKVKRDRLAEEISGAPEDFGSIVEV